VNNDVDVKNETLPLSTTDETAHPAMSSSSSSKSSVRVSTKLSRFVYFNLLVFSLQTATVKLKIA